MESNLKAETYREQILRGIPRILAALDRDAMSYTFGSFDREYWSWATKDFSNIDLQRAIYPLTLIYLNDFEGNQYHGRQKLLKWILGAVKFWIQQQKTDGSFDHHYPNEYSYVGVAFTLYEISEAYRAFMEVGTELPGTLHEAWLNAMKHAASFIMRHDESHAFISNHRAGAACALYCMFLITGENQFQTRAFELMKMIWDNQSSEGWYLEYSGADPGYQTLDTYYQANFYRLTGDSETLERLRSSLKFLIYFFHPDGSVGGEYGSRNCPLYYPSGFELVMDEIPEASAIAFIGAEGIQSDANPTLTGMDIRNFVPMLSSYVQAFFSARGNGNREGGVMDLPFQREFEIYWPKAQLYVRSKSGFYTIVGLSKGGVIKVFDIPNKKLIASVSGYFGRANGSYFSNQMLDFMNRDEAAFASCNGNESAPREVLTIDCSSMFYEVSHKRIMTPFRFLLFRIFNFTIGQIRFLNHFIRKHIIVGFFIYRRKRFPLELKRHIAVHSDGMAVKDRISSKGTFPNVNELFLVDIFTTVYMGSSKYFRYQELIPEKIGEDNLMAKKSGQTVEVDFKIDGSGVHLG